MDPDANLKEQLELANRIISEPNDSMNEDGSVDRLAELVIALNAWISNGGFLPAAWKPPFDCPHCGPDNCDLAPAKKGNT